MKRRSELGITYMEVMATAGILMILAALILPTAKASHMKAKEIELNRALREIRSAIDEYHARCANIPNPSAAPGDGIQITCQGEGYPEELKVLEEGADRINVGTGVKKYIFLRKVPKDPMTEDGEWTLICTDLSTSSDSCRQGIWDVRSKSERPSISDPKKKHKDF